MRTLKLTIAYDGTDFAGWQNQPGQRTVQATLEQSLSELTGEPIAAVASGRTDAGVHALGQVVSFDTGSDLASEVFQRALNAKLPEDVAVLAVVEAPPGFHAIRDAVKKRYQYRLHDGPTREVFHRRYAWHVRHRLDAGRMHRAGQALVGRRDFHSFESHWPNRNTSVRSIFELSVKRQMGDNCDRVTLEVEADGFLYHMVRTIAGTLVEVGRGAQDESWPADVLAAEDRAAAGPTAPPQGLFLLRVEYDSGSTSDRRRGR